MNTKSKPTVGGYLATTKISEKEFGKRCNPKYDMSEQGLWPCPVKRGVMHCIMVLKTPGDEVYIWDCASDPKGECGCQESYWEAVPEPYSGPQLCDGGFTLGL